MDLVFPNRIARLSYLVRNIIVAAVCVAAAPLFERDEGDGVSAGAILCALIILFYWAAFVAAPRCRDTGISPWLGLLAFVPGVNIFIGGYLTWKRSWPATDGLSISSNRLPSSPGGDLGDSDGKSDALRRLETLRDDGVLTEQDFLRRKARLGKNEWFRI